MTPQDLGAIRGAATPAAPEARPDPDVEKLADLFMDLRLDGPAADGWTYQQTARHYARIILGRWLAGIRQDPSDPLATPAAPEARRNLSRQIDAMYVGGHPLRGYSRERQLGWDEAIATVRAALAALPETSA